MVDRTKGLLYAGFTVFSLLLTPWFSDALAQPPQPDAGNGIRVLEPKQYPYRHLEKMIADLDAQLALVRSVDAARIAQQVSALQGSSRRSRQLAATVTQSPLPSVTTELEAGAEGELEPQKATVDQVAVTPTAPTLDALPGGGLSSPNFGFAASDVLSEQVQLQYQVYNLRLLQQRAISDRFFDDGTNQGSRVLAVVGVTVELEPRRQHRKSAAMIELTIEPATPRKTAPSLVALMPEEKTYNSVAHSTKSNAFGGAALAGVFSLGFSGKWQSDKLYLYQDNDTVAFSHPRSPTSPRQLTFGWQFRPVLGRDSVDPGRRHLFAVIALDELETSKQEQSFPFEVSMRSYWLKYSNRQRVARGPARDNRESKESWKLEIKNAVVLHKGWSPRVESVTASSIDRENLLVKVQGDNFLPAPTVQIGDRTLASDSDLVHRSDGSLQFMAPTKELLEKHTRVTGAEYGFSVPLEQKVDPARDTGLDIAFFEFGAQRQGNLRELIIYLIDRDASGTTPDLQDRSVFAIFSGKVYELTPGRWHPDGNAAGRLVGSVEVPMSDVKADSELSVQIPFLGERYVAHSNAHQATGISRVVLLESGDPVVWGLVGWGFTNSLLGRISVYAGERYDHTNGLSLASAQLLTLQAAKAKLSKQKKVLAFLPGYLEPITLAAPGVPAEAKPPVPAGPPPSAPQNSSGSVTFTGTGLAAITKVTFEGESLQILATRAGLRVFLTRAVTKHKGSVELLGFWDESKFVVLKLTVN